MSVSPNPRVSGSVDDGVVTQADLQDALDRVRSLATITFKSEDDMYDSEVRGKSKAFKEALWDKLRENE
jgi:hypothetical protein